jgi:hypothetical protein
MVEKHNDGILAYCDKPISLGYLECSEFTGRKKKYYREIGNVVLFSGGRIILETAPAGG